MPYPTAKPMATPIISMIAGSGIATAPSRSKRWDGPPHRCCHSASQWQSGIDAQQACNFKMGSCQISKRATKHENGPLPKNRSGERSLNDGGQVAIRAPKNVMRFQDSGYRFTLHGAPREKGPRGGRYRGVSTTKIPACWFPLLEPNQIRTIGFSN